MPVADIARRHRDVCAAECRRCEQACRDFLDAIS